MADGTNGAAAPSKSKTEYTPVTMSDGRVVQFAGKRKVNKETLIDESKIIVDGDTLQMEAGAIKVRMDFRNGDTRTWTVPLSLVPRTAGHGGEQKLGDELASPADKPLSEEDMVLAIDDLISVLDAGNWGKGRAEGGGGVSGASVVVQAIMEASGKDMQTVKDYLQKKLAASKAHAEATGEAALTRQALYASFRNPNTQTGKIVARIEAEKLAKASKVDADAELANIG